MLKLRQVAQRLNCSLSNVYALVESGELAHTPIGAGGKGIRVSEDQFKTFLAQRRLRRKQGAASGAESENPPLLLEDST